MKVVRGAGYTCSVLTHLKLHAHLMQLLQLLLVLLLRLQPLRLPGLHLTLVVLLQGQVRGVTDRQGLLQLCVLGSKCVMLGALVHDPPACQQNVWSLHTSVTQALAVSSLKLQAAHASVANSLNRLNRPEGRL